MLDTEVRSAVNEYLAHHLDSEYWEGLDEKRQSATFAMAASDILAALSATFGDIKSANSAVVKAIAEQAVFLSRNYDSMSEGKIVTSESVEGVSVGYTILGTSFSSRAEVFLKQAKREILGGSTRISRG